MELQYYEHLLELQKQGHISSIELQPHVVIIRAFEKYGKKHRKAVYTPDFLVHYANGTHAYIEVKGFSKPDADLRRKLFDSLYPDELIWVTGVERKNKRYTRWVNYDDLKVERRKRKKAKEEQKNAKV